MLDGHDKQRLAQEGVDYLVEQNILLKNRIAHLISENSVLKDKIKKASKALKEMLIQGKKVLVESS
jgi:hypothetical protein